VVDLLHLLSAFSWKLLIHNFAVSLFGRWCSKTLPFPFSAHGCLPLDFRFIQSETTGTPLIANPFCPPLARPPHNPHSVFFSVNMIPSPASSLAFLPPVWKMAVPNKIGWNYFGLSLIYVFWCGAGVSSAPTTTFFLLCLTVLPCPLWSVRI